MWLQYVEEKRVCWRDGMQTSSFQVVPRNRKPAGLWHCILDCRFMIRGSAGVEGHMNERTRRRDVLWAPVPKLDL